MQLSDVVRIALIFSEDAKRYAKKLAGSIDLSGKADQEKAQQGGQPCGAGCQRQPHRQRQGRSQRGRQGQTQQGRKPRCADG